MKKIVPLLCILIAMSMSCRKHVAPDCLKVKIIRITCAGTVMQVLNNNSIGYDGWLDIYGNNAWYDNVFTATNTCDLPSEYKAGDIVYITTAKSTGNDCVHCALYDAPPKISYDIKTISALPCNGAKTSMDD